MVGAVLALVSSYSTENNVSCAMLLIKFFVVAILYKSNQKAYQDILAGLCLALLEFRECWSEALNRI